MKALGLVFSARKRGNCLSCAEFVLKILKGKGFETEVVSMYDYNIQPCNHCNYQCFKRENCPINDDIPRIYEKMLDADVLLFFIPTYGSNVSGLYKAWAERGQAIMRSISDCKRYLTDKIRGFVVIGSIPFGGDKAFHVVIPEYYESRYRSLAIMLSPDESGNTHAWLNGNMVEGNLVKLRLEHFATEILEEVGKKLKEES